VESVPRPRIEVYQNGCRIPLAPRSPVLSASVSLGEDVILERHITPQGAEYRERASDTHLLFLSDSEPVRATCRMDGRQLNGKTDRGNVWILPRSIPHNARFEGPHGGLVLSIGNLWFESHIGPLTHGGQIQLNPQFNVRDSQLEHLLRGLLAVALDGEQADALVGDLLVNAVCIRLAKRYAVTKWNVVPPRGGLSAPQLKRALEYIGANLDGKITLSALSETAHMSLYYFATRFKQSTGLSPLRYVLQQRIRRAEQLLRDMRLSVLDVGLSLGFEHQSNFARAFRRVTGVSPIHFRQDSL
jgi:AraC family transcriptional regulator